MTTYMQEYQFPDESDQDSNENQCTNPDCPNPYESIVDSRSGELICQGCGSVLEERIISEEAEYRVFQDDSESKKKVRVGDAYNPYLDYSLTDKNNLERDEREFLWDGLSNIDESMFRLFQGGTITKIKERAKELFHK